MGRVQVIKQTLATVRALGFGCRFEDGCYCLQFGDEPGSRNDFDDYCTPLAGDVIEAARWECYARQQRARSRLLDPWRKKWGVA